MMRLLVMLMLAGLVQISSTAYCQTITFKGKNVPIEEVFATIQGQTGYRTAGKKELLKQGKPVTLDVKKMALKAFLDLVVETQPFGYQIVEKNIIIADRLSTVKDRLGIPITMKSNNFLNQLKGTVTDEEGKPIVGANVGSKDDVRLSTVTNEQGEFLLTMPPGKILVLKHLAFQAKELSVEPGMYSGPFKVTLQVKLNDLEEVKINKGYYNTSKALNTGSVVSISAKEIERQPVTNVLQALQSRIPGMIINQQSGVPGSNFNIQIRGRNSINKSNPLFVIDGIPFNMDAMGQIAGQVAAFGNTVSVSGSGSAAGTGGLSPLNSINPEDIESVEVLKDADATAIYGSLGANGVVLITTKKGKAGPLTANGNFNMGFSGPSGIPEFLDTKQYLKYRRQLFANDGTKPGPADLDLNGTWDTTRYTRWGEELIGRKTINSSSRVSLSGGSIHTQFQLGLGHTSMSPPYEGDFSNDRTSLNLSLINTSADKKFRMVFSGNFSRELNNLPGLDIAQFVNLAPNGPSLHNPDGTLNWWSPSATNPYSSLLQTYRASGTSLQGNAQLSYQLFHSLRLKANLGYGEQQFNERRLNPTTSFNPALNTPGSALSGSSTGSNWIIEPQAEFDHEVLGGKLALLAGTTFQDRLSTGQTNSATGFPSDALLSNMAAASRFVISNRYAQYRYSAIFGRINYTLKERYVLNLTGRRDGSSRFAPGRQFGNFGAVGLAWVFGREDWITENFPVLSFGKIRTSYGVTGNDQIGDYRYLESYLPQNSFTYLGSAGLTPSRLFNPNYGWESNKKFEVAAELGFFDDRISMTTAYFRNRSSNQLVNVPLAPTTGNATIQANLPALIQNKGFEVDFTTKNLRSISDGFNWSTTFNITFERNKLLEFPGIELSSYADIYVVGEPLAISQRLNRMVGVNPKTGLYEFMDKDGNIVSNLTIADRIVRVNTNPKYYGGLGNSFSYKGFQLDVQLQFVKQLGRNPLLSNALGGSLPFTNLTNVPAYYDGQIWMREGDITRLQRLSGGGLNPAAAAVANGNFYAQNSDAVYSDASYIRCKNVALSWNVDPRLVRAIHIKNLRLYTQAQNLFTITNYQGFDPESQGSVLPPLRTLVFGLQFTL